MLYHGTSSRHLSKILAEGIRPRHRKNSVWDCASIDSHVYMTEAYALHYAGAAADDKDNLLIAEIDPDELDRHGTKYPDEDFLAQVAPHNFLSEKNLIEKTKWFAEHIDDYQIMWSASLKGLGNMALRGLVPVTAIKRIAVIDRKAPIRYASDPSITITNFRLLGSYYKKLSQHIFEPVQKSDDEECFVMRKVHDIPRKGIEIMEIGK